MVFIIRNFVKENRKQGIGNGEQKAGTGKWKQEIGNWKQGTVLGTEITNQQNHRITELQNHKPTKKR